MVLMRTKFKLGFCNRNFKMYLLSQVYKTYLPIIVKFVFVNFAIVPINITVSAAALGIGYTIQKTNIIKTPHIYIISYLFIF
jgi:hypothetical protein